MFVYAKNGHLRPCRTVTYNSLRLIDPVLAPWLLIGNYLPDILSLRCDPKGLAYTARILYYQQDADEIYDTNIMLPTCANATQNGMKLCIITSYSATYDFNV
ncbi:hypothetical protein SNK03_13628 [Fusarium graminearum]|uniref:Chromosome 4, complete genome n=2 Tax=Gibberella zeae TaxID=5518 RepID=I1S8Q8_GIBZE|nr:hypothetical protein FGSG_13236 [Fusarium graminearum PH-1]ESU14186.1 hypothetical protein FGSG_13236 [Fusarium graminearum PH-1]EYB33641.1 hypothetical protein FG05_13236 [Fusarium graminearum]CAG1979336.1 unnamed protein product [Fusarium graminearum]CEF85175.1 unnamed protein product [Fusarium graminearum]|eukprot:XP_011327693.1 hypothetical protein FGSG_13236 [Fusarium graminearum PH-1]